MARKSPNCPPTVEPNEFGCVWNFSGMFDHHHHYGRHHRKLLSNGGHGSKRNQVPMLTFDEQLKNINIDTKKKNESQKVETSSSNHTVEESFWKKIKSRYENPNKKKENPVYNSIVVLKPSQHVLKSPVNVGCGCSYLHSHHKSTNNQQIVKQNRVSFNDVRKKLKGSKKVKKNARKARSREGYEGGRIDENAPRPEKVKMVPFLKQREPDVFVEARRHLAERLRQVVMGECEKEASSSKRVSRTLERVLLSSPIHMSIATFDREIEEIRIEKRLLNMDSDPNNIGAMEVSRMEMTLDVSSPKVNFKSENMETDQFRENPSPISVLESVFADNISSPTSTNESTIEHHLQPPCLDFEEHSQTSSPPHPKTNLSSSFMEDRGLISTYVHEIYEASESNWEDFLATDYTSELSCDHKLLHGCVKEVLIGLNLRVTFVSEKIRAFSLEKDVVNEVMEQVDWHNGQPMIPRTLDNLVRRDIAKGGEWVDVANRNDVVFEVVDETLQVLIMEAISDISV